MPARDHRRHGRARLHDIVERGEGDLRVLRFRRQLHGDFGDHGEQPFGPVDEREQVIARAVQRVAAELDDLAGDQHRAHAVDVVNRQSVLQAVNAAGVLGDVAADRAGDLRRRIGRVVKTVRCSRFGDRQVAHAGLDDRRSRERVDGEDPPELGERQQHATLVGHRAAGETRPRAAGDHRHPRRVAAPEDLDHLRLAVGDGDGGGQFAINGQAVAFVRPCFFGRRQQRRRRQDRRKLGMDGGIEHLGEPGKPRRGKAPRQQARQAPDIADYSTSPPMRHVAGARSDHAHRQSGSKRQKQTLRLPREGGDRVAFNRRCWTPAFPGMTTPSTPPLAYGLM